MTTKREEAIRLAEQAGFHTNEYGVYSPYIEGSSLNVPIIRLIQLAKNEAYREAAQAAGAEDSYQDEWFKAKSDSHARIMALIKE